MNIQLLPIDELLSHEEVDSSRVEELVSDFQENYLLRVPILVSRGSMVILDGHHRVAALKAMGVLRVPAYMVDYFSNVVTVKLRRPELSEVILKEAVVSHAKTGQLFPQKTTRHEFKIPVNRKFFEIGKF